MHLPCSLCRCAPFPSAFQQVAFFRAKVVLEVGGTVSESVSALQHTVTDKYKELDEEQKDVLAQANEDFETLSSVRLADSRWMG